MAKAQDKETFVLSKLDRIIRLLAVNVAADKPQRERIRLLSSAGLAPKEIAEALGTTPNTVRVALTGIRRSQRRRGR
jgi:DNA-binding CsgD family transcriptional regulator